MIQARDNAACAVFEGKIVVSGGYDNNDNDLNTVETYDVIGNEWSPMADMISVRFLKALVKNSSLSNTV